MPGWVKFLIACIATALCFVLAAVLVVIWPEATSDRWQAAEAVAAATAAVAAIPGLGALWLLWIQVKDIRRQTRRQLSPYIRVDLSMDGVSGTWTAPRVAPASSFDYASFNPGAPALGDLLGAWPGAAAEVSLYLTNTQHEPAAVAYNVHLDLEFEVPTIDGRSRTVLHPVTVAYLGPRQRIRYRVAAIGAGVPFLAGEVAAVVYTDMDNRLLGNAHGRAQFVWDGSTVTHGPKAFLGEE